MGISLKRDTQTENYHLIQTQASRKVYLVEEPFKGIPDRRAAHAALVLETWIEGSIKYIRYEVDKSRFGLNILCKSVTDSPVRPGIRSYLIQVGITLHSDKFIMQESVKWMTQHPRYYVWSSNCRAFVDYLLKNLVRPVGFSFVSFCERYSPIEQINKEKKIERKWFA